LRRAAVADDLEAGRSELKALELPADQRKKAEPFLRDVDSRGRYANGARGAAG
jgi:hypothetical protein